MQDDYNALARGFGYEDYKYLLEDLYINDGLTVKQVAAKLNKSTFTISHHLEEYGIPKRRPGGAQNLSKKKWKLFRLDPRVIWSFDNITLGNLLKMDKSTVYKYKREVYFHANVYYQSNRRAGEVLNTQQRTDGPVSGK